MRDATLNKDSHHAPVVYMVHVHICGIYCNMLRDQQAKQHHLANLPLPGREAGAGRHTKLGPAAADRTVRFFCATDGDALLGDVVGRS